MALPTVAIIGRPNVGKSSLLNALAGQMISIVEPTPGVTRDRVSTLIDVEDRYIELIDTGGYGIVDSDQLAEHINSQITKAMEQANLVIFLVDIRDGVTILDETIAKLLRKQNLPVILAANKADNAKMFPMAAEFMKLGFGEPLCISAVNNLNKKVLMERVVEAIEHLPKETYKKETMKLALVGKRNAGKSTFINAIAGEERVIVSEVPGTTRDAVDVRFEKDGHTFVAIDTAGVRKKSSMSDSIEFYSYTRATRSIKRADVVLFLIDATVEISQVDKKLAKFISSNYKACILVVNKWDLAKDRADTEDYHGYLNDMLPGLRHCPIAFTTASEARNIQSVLDLAMELFKQATAEIATPMLNKAIAEIAELPFTIPRKRGGRPKIYYGTQVAANPVTLLLFVNRPELFDESFRRFLIGQIRERLPIDEVPIRLLVRHSSSRPKE